MRRALGVIVFAAVAGVSVPAAAAMITPPANPASQRFGVRLVDVPVSEAHNPRGLRYIIDFLHPGTTIRRRILIENLQSRRVQFTVYPDAAMIKQGYFIGAAGQARSELTTWISLQHSQVTLDPGRSALDLVTIKVPKVATRGEHYGVIWVQQIARAHPRRGIAITEINRVGIRIYLAIGKGGAPPTRFVITSVGGHISAYGRLFLTATVHNTGGRAVDLSGSARLTGGPGGSAAGPFSPVQVLTLAPGQSGQVTFGPPRGLPIGPWQARVTLISGLTVERASATIFFSGHRPSASWWRGSAMFLWISGLAALVVVLAGLIFRLRSPRRLRSRWAHALRAR